MLDNIDMLTSFHVRALQTMGSYNLGQNLNDRIDATVGLNRRNCL